MNKYNDVIKDILSGVEKEVMKYAYGNNGVINSICKVANMLNKSNIIIQRAITRLVSLNLLERIGSRKVGYWKIK